MADFTSFAEAEALADAASASAVESPQKISAAPEHHCGAEDDDDDRCEDFEFAFVIKDLESGPAITADEIFSNGQIRPVYPVFKRDLLLANSGGTMTEQAARPPLRKLLIKERNASSSASSPMDELDGIPPESYCMWMPVSSVPSPARSKKSRSTGLSFRWRIRDLLGRSHSDGKEKFVFVASQERNHGHGYDHRPPDLPGQ